ncbi:GDSL esterase/lipase [Vigna angularis]|uniref:GDSL esterase/lipase n=1 Tax=Phaseolus angularis TaxID=3914 RepID=A0A8T0KNQ9_PHAAN|nr:GDSL esterase/lipase [Vigna angularis]
MKGSKGKWKWEEKVERKRKRRKNKTLNGDGKRRRVKDVSVIPLSEQLEQFKEYIGKLKANFGEARTNFILSKSLVLVVSSSNDIANTYFASGIRKLDYDVPSYTDMLVQLASSFVKICEEWNPSDFRRRGGIDSEESGTLVLSDGESEGSEKVMEEMILPVNIKGLAGSIATMGNWLIAWVITMTTNLLLNWSSGGGVCTNLSQVRARIDSLQQFLSQSISTSTPLTTDQIVMVSTHINSSIPSRATSLVRDGGGHIDGDGETSLSCVKGSNRRVQCD